MIKLHYQYVTVTSLYVTVSLTQTRQLQPLRSYSNYQYVTVTSLKSKLEHRKVQQPQSPGDKYQLNLHQSHLKGLSSHTRTVLHMLPQEMTQLLLTLHRQNPPSAGQQRPAGAIQPLAPDPASTTLLACKLANPQAPSHWQGALHTRRHTLSTEARCSSTAHPPTPMLQKLLSSSQSAHARSTQCSGHCTSLGSNC